MNKFAIISVIVVLLFILYFVNKKSVEHFSDYTKINM